jgi:hypothetical protein
MPTQIDTAPIATTPLGPSDYFWGVQGGAAKRIPSSAIPRVGDAISLTDFTSAGLAAAIIDAGNTARVLNCMGKTITLGSAGIKHVLAAGKSLRIRDLKIDMTATTATMSLGTGWSSIIGLGIVAESAAGVSLWSATYPRTTITAVPNRGDNSLIVADTSLFAPGVEALLHDTTRVWDADGTIQSEGVMVLSRSVASGPGTLVLRDILFSTYTTAATLRPWLAADVDISGLEIIGGGSGLSQDGFWTLGVRGVRLIGVSANGVESRGFSCVNGARLDASDVSIRNVSKTGLGYGIMANGTNQVALRDISGYDVRHTVANGRGASASQMTRQLSVNGVRVAGASDAAVNAHPGVYAAQITDVIHMAQRDGTTSGDAAILYMGTHLNATNIRTGQSRRHSIAILPYGHKDETTGAVISLSNIQSEPNGAAGAQYGVVFNDSQATGIFASTSPVASLAISNSSLVSRSGTAIFTGTNDIRSCTISGSRVASRTAADAGHGFLTQASGTGRVADVSAGQSTFESNGGGGYAAVFIGGRLGAVQTSALMGCRTRGAHQWGVRVTYGTVSHAALDATGFSTSATVADVGGTVTAIT